MLFGSRLPERVRETVLNGLGLFIIAYGIKATLESQNVLIVLGSVLIDQRLRDGVVGVLRGANDDFGIDSGRADRRLPTAGA
jgi:uncharacterized membrane protein YqgA involved in biofilm formation